MASQIRLELSTTNPDLQDGLQARMHDPSGCWPVNGNSVSSTGRMPVLPRPHRSW